MSLENYNNSKTNKLNFDERDYESFTLEQLDNFNKAIAGVLQK